MKISSAVLDAVDAHRRSWGRDKIVTVENFLAAEDADTVAVFLESIPDAEWAVSVHPHHPTIYTFDNSPENQPTIEAAVRSAAEEYARGGFSYHFRRREPAANGRFDFCRFLSSELCGSLLQQITGRTLKDSVSVFCSCYEAGCFLSTHTDMGRGTIAFVYNATRSWDPADGGQFQLLSRDWSSVVRTVQPLYNTFTIFEVEGQGVPHRVLPVAAKAKARRLAISGWLV